MRVFYLAPSGEMEPDERGQRVQLMDDGSVHIAADGVEIHSKPGGVVEVTHGPRPGYTQLADESLSMFTHADCDLLASLMAGVGRDALDDDLVPLIEGEFYTDREQRLAGIAGNFEREIGSLLIETIGGRRIEERS